MVASVTERRAKAQEERGMYNPLWKPEETVSLTPRQEDQEIPWETHFPERTNQGGEEKDTRSFLEIMQQGFFDTTIKPILSLFGFERGTEYIHETMPIMAHRGESIVPAGRQQGNGGVTIEHVTIQVKEIAEIGSAEKIASVLARANSARLTRNGKTTFEVI